MRQTSVPKPPPNDPMAAFLSPASTHLPRSCKARRWIDLPFRCLARDQNGCDTRLRGAREARFVDAPTRRSYDRS
jgi:hypothetical protein